MSMSEIEQEEHRKRFQHGVRVAYIPTHALGDIQHPDVEFGIVSSPSEFVPSCVFVRYFPQLFSLGWENTTSQRTNIWDLTIIGDIPEWVISKAEERHGPRNEAGEYTCTPPPAMNLPVNPLI